MSWLEVAAAVDQEAVEAVAERLRCFGQGVAIEPAFLQPSVDEAPELDPSRPVLVKTYVPDDAAAASLCHQIEEALWHLGRLRPVQPLSFRRIREEDWANAWKAFFPVVRVGRAMVIVPPWRRYRRKTGQIVLRLDPGLAFGTGTHPTTRLCLLALEQLLGGDSRDRPATVLDVGTGSGILAIAAAQLGADRVLAIDIDPVAVSAAQANVRLNRLSRRVSVRLGSPEGPNRAASAPPWDLVLCNVSARGNAALAQPLAGLTATGGSLVASGMLKPDLPWVERALRAAGFEPVERQQEGDWASLVAVRRG